MLSLASPINTPYHRLPPTPKFAFLCGFTFTVFMTDNPLHLAAAFTLVAALHALPGHRFCLLGLKRLAPVWPFLAVILCWHLATRDYMGGIAVGLRLLAAIALANLVTMTTRLDELVAIVGRLATPFERFGVNRRGLGLAVALVVRFTPVLAQKAGWLLESWRGRSTRRPGWRIVLPIAAIALDDADHVAEALRARGGI